MQNSEVQTSVMRLSWGQNSMKQLTKFGKNMNETMINKFTPTTGKYIEKITGQDRLAFAMSDNEDLYDLIAWSKQGGYQGAVLFFYDFETGEAYQPFEKKRNIVYGRPEFADGFYYFLRGDYDEKNVVLYRYFRRVYWSLLRRGD